MTLSCRRWRTRRLRVFRRLRPLRLLLLLPLRGRATFRKDPLNSFYAREGRPRAPGPLNVR